MSVKIQYGKLLYHITAIDNLESIFKYGLLSRQDALNKKLIKEDVADAEIIKKRKELIIDNFVPFHFFEPTPFTGAVFQSHPKVSFCCITITRDFAKQQNFKICTAHPLSENPKAEIKSYEDGFKAIDWENAEKRDYSSDVSKNACMAECLAISPITHNNFQAIYVVDEKTKKLVENLAINIIGDYSFYIDINPTFTKSKSNDCN